MDLARANGDHFDLASNVLIISVLAIIFTAPIGAILMLRLAPLWLQRSSATDTNGFNSNKSTSIADENGAGLISRVDRQSVNYNS